MTTTKDSKSMQISLPFKTFIFRHWKETERASNTARLIAELLSPVQVIDYGIDEVNCEYFDPNEAVLLYPPDQPNHSNPILGSFKSPFGAFSATLATSSLAVLDSSISSVGFADADATRSASSDFFF